MKIRLFLSLFFVCAIGCVSYDNFDTKTVEGSFGLAMKLSEDSRYEEALLQFRDVKNKYPYSKFATESELQIAEIHFKKDAFQEAQSAYSLFKELHPKHAKMDYVTYQIGESIYNQLPSTVDRDLTLAPQSIRMYRLVLKDYPQSALVQKARERIQEVTNKMADKELYIADFYFRTENFQSALVRYEKFLKDYPTHPKVARAMLKAGQSAANSDNAAKKASMLRSLVEKFPESNEAQQAKREL